MVAFQLTGELHMLFVHVTDPLQAQH